jgi:hypothetical protein
MANFTLLSLYPQRKNRRTQWLGDCMSSELFWPMWGRANLLFLLESNTGFPASSRLLYWLKLGLILSNLQQTYETLHTFQKTQKGIS